MTNTVICVTVTATRKTDRTIKMDYAWLRKLVWLAMAAYADVEWYDAAPALLEQHSGLAAELGSLLNTYADATNWAHSSPQLRRSEKKPTFGVQTSRIHHSESCIVRAICLHG